MQAPCLPVSPSIRRLVELLSASTPFGESIV
jgi:hypothetical protein